MALVMLSVYWVHKDGGILISVRCCLFQRFSCAVNGQCSSRFSAGANF